MKTSISSKLFKLIPALALSLVLGLILTTGLSGKVSAVSANISFSTTKTAQFSSITGAKPGNGGVTRSDYIDGGLDDDVANVFEIDIDPQCLQYVVSVSIYATYNKSANLYHQEDGASIMLGDSSIPTPWGTTSNEQGHFYYMPGIVAADLTNLGGSYSPSNDGDQLGAVWSDVSPPSVLDIMILADANRDRGPSGEYSSVTVPSVDITYAAGAGASCANNQPPTPSTDTSTTTPSTPVTINPLTNDSDPDNDTLTITNAVVSSGDTNGTVTINNDGTITYTPSSGFTGTTTITYTVDDGNGGTATSTLTITVATDAVVTVPVTTANTTPTSTTSTKPTLAKTGQNQVAILSLVVLSLVGAMGVKRKLV